MRYVTCFVVILLLSSSLAPSIVPRNENRISEVSSSANVKSLSSYSLHDPILIEEESSFISEGFTGSGTLYDPYILQGVRIENVTTCVSIRGVDSIFILKDCEFVSEGSREDPVMNVILFETFLSKIINCSFVNGGVHLDFSQGCNISDSEFLDSYFGVYFGDSDDTKVVRNVIENCSLAIVGYWSESAYIRGNCIINCDNGISTLDDSTIIDNTIDNAADMGIRIGSDTAVSNNEVSNCAVGVYLSTIADDSDITSNIIATCDIGISTYYARDCNVIENTILNCRLAGISFEKSRMMTVSSNDFHNCGLIVEDPSLEYWNHTIENNSIDGRNLGYLRNLGETLVDISGFGQLILLECTGTGVRNGTFHDVPFGICLAWSSSCDVQSTSFTNGSKGLWLLYSNDCSLEDSTFMRTGVTIDGSTESHWTHRFENNSVNGKELGIFAHTADEQIDPDDFGQIIFFDSENLTVSDGAIEHTTRGIQVAFSSSCEVLNVQSSENTLSGIFLFKSIDCLIQESTFHCNRNGIRIASQSSIFRNNSIQDNWKYGILADSSSSGNNLYYNIIGHNHVNAFSYTSANRWDDSERCGNFWGDYEGSGYYFIGTDLIGLWKPVYIVDCYPNGTIADSTNPEIDHPPDITTTSHAQGVYVEWVAYDEYLGDYVLYRNGTLVDSGEIGWENNVRYNLDSLAVGIHNFTVRVYDLIGNMVSDSVFVTVVYDGTPTTFTNTTGLSELDPIMLFPIVIGTFAVILVVIYYERRKISVP